MFMLDSTTDFLENQSVIADGDMPRGSGHTSHNLHARDMIYISKHWHCQCESIDMQTMSLACILSET